MATLIRTVIVLDVRGLLEKSEVGTIPRIPVPLAMGQSAFVCRPKIPTIYPVYATKSESAIASKHSRKTIEVSRLTSVV
jgi:hypothetical protein